MIVANAANEQGAGFAVDTNKVTLITTNNTTALPLMSKRECAVEIFDAIERLPSGGRHVELTSGVGGTETA